MINQGFVETHSVETLSSIDDKPVDSVFGRECCAFITSHCSTSLSGSKRFIFPYVKNSQLSPMFKDDNSNIKIWEFICNNAGFNWEYCGVSSPSSFKERMGKGDYWHKFKIDTQGFVFDRQALMVFSSIRYMYSPLYNVIPEKAVEFYKINDGNIPDALSLVMFSHVFRDGYNNYYGLNPHKISYWHEKPLSEVLSYHSRGSIINGVMTAKHPINAYLPLSSQASIYISCAVLSNFDAKKFNKMFYKSIKKVEQLPSSERDKIVEELKQSAISAMEKNKVNYKINKSWWK